MAFLRRFLVSYWPDLALALALFAIAFALRLPNLTLVPPLWDSEAAEALDATDIATGQTLPLVLPTQPHLGAVAAYPLALLMRLFGITPFAPRLFIALCGAVTVVVSFLLARQWGGWLAGGVAGLLLALNPFHIFINSHVYWTNSITPLLTTCALVLLSAGVRFEQGTREAHVLWLASLGVFGLALQSHPSVVALVPAIGLWLLARRDGLARLRDPWLYVGVLVALLAYSNMIVYNLANGFRSLAVAGSKSYALPEESAAVSGYADRLHDLTVELLRLITATTQADISWSLLNVLVTLWFLVAVMLSLKTTRGLLLGSTLSAALIIAYANKVYGAGYAERYIMYMLPIAFVAMALAVEAAWRRLRVARVPSAVARAAALLGLVLLGWYAVRAWLTLDGYYQTEIAQGRSNQPQLAWNDLAQPYARDGYRVLVGTRLDNEFVVQFGSTYGLVQMYLLRMQGFAPSMVSRDDIRRIIEQNPEIRNLLLLERTGEYAVLRTQVPLCVVSGLPGRVMAVYKGAPCQ